MSIYQSNEQVPVIQFRFKAATLRMGNLYYPWEKDEIISIEMKIFTFVEMRKTDKQNTEDDKPDAFVFKSEDDKEWVLMSGMEHIFWNNYPQDIFLDEYDKIGTYVRLSDFLGDIYRGINDLKIKSETSDSVKEKALSAAYYPLLQTHYDNMVKLVEEKLGLKTITSFKKFGDRQSLFTETKFELIKNE